MFLHQQRKWAMHLNHYAAVSDIFINRIFFVYNCDILCPKERELIISSYIKVSAFPFNMLK